MKEYRRLDLHEREMILRLRAWGESRRSIAKFLRRSPSTISRELQRNTIQFSGYCPDLAHRLAEARQRICVGHNRRRPDYKRLVGVRDFRLKLPRVFIAWHSDDKFYRRGLTGFIGSQMYRLRSLFKTDDKPFHYFDLFEHHRLLRRWWRWREFRADLKAIQNGEKVKPPPQKRRPSLSYSKSSKTEATPKIQPDTHRRAG
ncbi:hypothetical protein FUAX_05260 [Fulvitalea axinellae]|uniref:Transposase IS30-like HTH domain-containing protein n=1 Tax=Fulvitalea axinellae TaxID=1182444 RepID=A0AAU9CP11_9BACT|nr:hypothetical protein FUAX_05260 [Fulvitalea axinellae]